MDLNPAAENILGISRKRAHGQSLLQLVDDEPEMREILSRVAATGDHYGNEMSGDEGALAAMWLGVKIAICCHFLNPEGRADVQKFVSMLDSEDGPKPVVLRPGETYEYGR